LPGCCGASSYASSGCSRWRHSLQYTLPGARATGLEQPSCWRLPPAMRHAMLRAGSSSGEAAHLLAPAAPAVCDTMLRVALSRLGAARVLASFAPSTMLRVAFSPLGAAVVLAPFAASMRHAEARVVSSCIGAALVLAPLAPPCALEWGVCRLELPWSIPCAGTVRPSTAVTHPLSVLNAPLVHIGHRVHTRWQCESRSNVAACLEPDGQQRLGGGRTVGL
jgi:hypothetical protein